MQDIADAKFVLSKEGRIKRNLVPVGLSRMRLSTRQNCVKLGGLLPVACRGWRFSLFGLVCSRRAEEH